MAWHPPFSIDKQCIKQICSGRVNKAGIYFGVSFLVLKLGAQ